MALFTIKPIVDLSVMIGTAMKLLLSPDFGGYYSEPSSALN
jgi:hypothetical protein